MVRLLQGLSGRFAAAFLLVFTMLAAGCAQPAQDASPPGKRLLFVQDAGRGTSMHAADGRLLLLLSGVDSNTLWFTDRPERDAGVIATKSFVSLWGEGEDSFADDPPNAALVVHRAAGEDDVYVVKLLSPIYDEITGILKYVAQPVDSSEAFLAEHKGKAKHGNELPASFGDVEVLIDSSIGTDAITDATDTSTDGGTDASPPAGPLKFGQGISIGFSADVGPYLSAAIVQQWLYESTVTLTSATPGENENFTIMCPVQAYDSRGYSCYRGIDRTLQYSDYVTFARVTGTPGLSYWEKMLGADQFGGPTSDESVNPGTHYVWVNDYGDGAEDERTWRILDPRNTGSTAEIYPGDPVAMVNVNSYDDDTSLRHPSGALSVQPLSLPDSWTQPTAVPTDADSRWYFQSV